MGPPGHMAIGLAAKPAAPRAPLWILMLATEILDLLSIVLVAVGVQRGGINGWSPWSHGLLMSAVWSGAAGVIAFIFWRQRRTSIVIGLLVLSHWGMDFIVHRAYLPLLFETSPLLGLGLGDSLAVDLTIEFSLLAAAIGIYLIWRRRKAADRLGT